MAIGQASFYEQVKHTKLLTIKQRFQEVKISPSSFIASEFQWYNIANLHDLTYLHQLFSSAVTASQLTLFF